VSLGGAITAYPSGTPEFTPVLSLGGAITAYPSRTPEFTPVFIEVYAAQSLLFYVVFCGPLFVILAIALFFLLRFTNSANTFW
jgi:hypothetical protein